MSDDYYTNDEVDRGEDWADLAESLGLGRDFPRYGNEKERQGPNQPVRAVRRKGELSPMLTPEAAQRLTDKVLDAMRGVVRGQVAYASRREAELDLAALQSYSYRTGYAEGQTAHQNNSAAMPRNPNHPGAN